MDGTPDTTLGSGTGYVTLDADNFVGGVASIADAQGNIICGSTTYGGNNVDSDITARSYTSEGVRRLSEFNWPIQFNYNMSSSSIGLDTWDGMRGVQMAPNGNVVLTVGMTYYGTPSPPESYGAGYVTLIPGVSNPQQTFNSYKNYYESVKSRVAIDADSNVYMLTGATRSSSNTLQITNIIYKRSASGGLYNAFGTNGALTLTLNVGGRPVNFEQIAIQPDGKLLLAGGTTNAASVYPAANLVLARFLPDGTLDTTFGTNGYILHDIDHPTTTANNNATGIILSPDGSDIYLVGNNSENTVYLKYSNLSLEPLAVPAFDPMPAICAGDTAPTLPATSTNGITGTWSPSTISNTTSGTYTFTPAATEHATTATLSVTVNQATTSSVTQSACEAYTWAANGTTYTESGTYTNVTTNAAGCSNTATLNLTINHNTTSSESVTACDTYTWPDSGIAYTESGTYTKVTTNAEGCSHTATLNLTINHSTTSTETATACETYTWAANGTTYTQSGTYTNITTNTDGCTNTATLHLTINNNTTSTVTQSACENYTWSANGLVYTESGTYTHVSTNAAGCTNTATLNLTINHNTTASISATACNSYLWSANGVNYTESGTYAYVTTNAQGCQHTTTLNLTINNSVAVTGNANQTLEQGATLANLVVSPSTVVWYASLEDALVPQNPLPATTPLLNNFTYFAVNTTGLGCVSVPFPVTVSVTLGAGHFDRTNFSLSPNPTSGSFAIRYAETIHAVNVFNVLGQEVLSKSINDKEATIDISRFPAGTYFVNVAAYNGSKTVKVIKQ
jgi:hypothetical protein